MPYGTGVLVRSALVKANPWQRYVICIAMIVAGAALAILGHVAGGLLAIGGIVLFGRLLRARRSMRTMRRRNSHARVLQDDGDAHRPDHGAGGESPNGGGPVAPSPVRR